MKCYILILILSKVLSSTRAIEFSNQYDITNALQDTIVGIFQTVEPQNISKIIATVINSDPVDINTPYNFTIPSSSSESARFFELRITNASSIDPCISYDFHNNKMNLYSPRFDVQLSGEMRVGQGYSREFNSYIHFRGCSISMIKQTSFPDPSFPLIDLQYVHLDTSSNGRGPSFWPTFEENMERISPLILQTLMNRNENFLDALDEIHEQSSKHIISKHLNFFGHEHQHHYLIPNAPIGSLNLRNIVVRGLCNFYTLNFTSKAKTVIYTLLIKDIRGSLILEDVSRTPTSSLELHFFADFLSISVIQKTSRVSVRAENFLFLETRLNTSLHEVQSKIIMDQVERAVGSSLMPSMEYQKSNRWSSCPNECEIENLLRQILIETQFNSDNKGSTRKSAYFEVDTATIPHMNTAAEYDITNTLKDTILGLFRNFRRRNVPQLIKQMNSFTHKTEHTSFPYFRIKSGYLERTRIWFGFHNNTMQISAQLVMHLTGRVKVEYECNFESTMQFDECSITVVGPKSSFEFPIVDFQYKSLSITLEGEAHRFPSICGSAEQVKKEIKSTMMSEMIEGIFWSNLMECFDHNPAKDISQYPYFLSRKQEYYYLIPEVPFASFRLRNITVTGLWDFYSLCFTDEPEVLTLTMKNIRGNMTLDEIATGSSLELNFFVDSLSIGVTWNTNQMNVEARNYSVFYTKTNMKLSELHSLPIIEHIESAIASSIEPSMTFQRTIRVSPFSSKSEMEKSFRRLLMENSFQSAEENIKQLHNTCIPIAFHDNNSSTKLPHSITINNNNICNNNQQYHLSFPNLTIIQFISGNQSHPEQIQCSLLGNSMFNHLINVVPPGKLFRNNDKAKSIDASFHFNVPFLNVSVIKQNNSKENNSCEFQISNNQDIEIHSSPAESNSTESDTERIEIKNKIDKTLMSMTKERIVRTVKSIACSSFDVCAQSARIIDEFFQRFVDKVLKKSSLRRNTT